MGQPFKLLSSLKKIKFPDNERFVRFSLFLKSKMTSRVTTSHGGMTEAVILSTSGTTGIPKKVVHSSFGINSIIFQYQTSGMVFKRGEIYISMAPLFLAFGVTLAIHLPLCAGVTSVICLDPDAKKSIKMFAKYRPNHFLCGDYHMLEMISNHAVKKMNLSFLRTIAIGGESLSVENLVKVNKFLKKHFSPVSLITGYGMTELGATAVTEMNDVRKIGTVGIPQNKVTVKVVDTENGKEKTYDETGEILINAPGMMMGYLNQPQETENSVEVDIMGKKWIHTGDLGKIDKDGFVYIQGRLKRIYRRLLPESGVFKVFPDYIEKTLDKHPAVKHCAVICVEDKTFITAPVAFIVLSQQVENPEKIFSEYIESEIGEYNVPVRYVLKKDMPLLANGKIDYCTLEQEVDIEEKV
jgi:long-chain acyl-CoA synthetase